MPTETNKKMQDFLRRLKGVEKHGDTYMALCPAHDDKHPSLSIRLSKDGKRIVIHCFAGCAPEEVMAALGLSMSDLFVREEKKTSRKVVKTTKYLYLDTDGTLLYFKIRTDFEDGTKKFALYQPDGRPGIKGIKRVPYNLHLIQNADIIYFVEGEKCADSIIIAGGIAITLFSGARSEWPPGLEKALDGKTVIIIPDNDKPGMEYAKMIQQHLPKAIIKVLPGLKEKEDIADWLAAGHSLTEIADLPIYEIPDEPEEAPSTEGENAVNGTQAATLMELIAQYNVNVFQDELDDLYAAIPIDGHMEIMRLDTRDFSSWLQGIYYKNTKRAIRAEAVTQVIALLSAQARFENGERRKLFNRVGKSDGAFWYDMSNSAWQAVKITSTGWGVIDSPPILFIRYRHQKPQVTPHGGGDIDRIFNYVAVKEFQLLFKCWLVTGFIPGIPHPMPIFYGEKGSAKSTSSAIIKLLIDPSAIDTLTLSNDQQTLVINLQQHWFLPFDNISSINGDTSDMLCRAITGGSVQQRRLYTNGDDYIFKFMRCLAVNGISNVVNRSDLLDRSLLFELERIPETERRELAEVYSSFAEERPALLGAIFDILSKAMALYPSVKLDKLPRMADFCRWGYAVAEVMGNQGQRFLQEYNGNCAIQNTEAINADSVATLVIEFMRGKASWTGRVSELLVMLTELAPTCGISRYAKNLPTQPNALSRRLGGIKSNLEEVGITFTRVQKTDATYITLHNDRLSTSPPVRVNPYDIVGSAHGDGNGDNDSNHFTPPSPEAMERLSSGDNGDDGDDCESVEF